jgi:hypothetical protein
VDDTPSAVTAAQIAVPRPRVATDDAMPAAARSPELQRLSQPVTFAPRRPGRRVLVLVLAAALAVVTVITLTAPRASRPVVAGQVVSSAPATSASPTPPSVDDVLTAQGRALVSGDRAGFLRPVAHADAKTRALYGMLYANLRALHVARWDQIAVEDGYDPAGALDGVRTEHLMVLYCFGDAACSATTVVMVVKIRAAGGTSEIVSAATPAVARTWYSRDTEVPPWALTPLRFAAAGRVIVAATGAESSALTSTLAIATRAVAVADRYAHWTRPHYYVLYLASTSEFIKWFSPDHPSRNTLGYTYNLSPGDAEVTIAMSRAAAYPWMGGVAGVVQHEFGHVATMSGLDPYGSSRAMAGEDSFLEGIAELCAYDGHTSWGRSRYGDVRDYIHSGKWSGHAFLTKEFDSSDNTIVSAAYGIGYLAMRRMVERFGKARTLDFWGAVERDDADFDHASRQILGNPWSRIEADIKSYVKRTVGA